MARIQHFLGLGLVLLLQEIGHSSGMLKYGPVTSYVRQQSDPDVIPILAGPDPSPVRVTLGLTLVQILDVNKDRNEVELLLWNGFTWKHEGLAWNRTREDFDIEKVRIPVDYLWTPDVSVWNSVALPELLSPALAVVSNDGSVTWFPSYRVRFTCELQDLESDRGSNCSLKMGSWTYNGFELDFELKSPEGTDLSEYVENPKYAILDVSATKIVMHYSCCPEPYVVLQFYFAFREKPVRHFPFMF